MNVRNKSISRVI